MKKLAVLSTVLLVSAAACGDGGVSPFSVEDGAAEAKIRVQNGGGSVSSARTVAGTFQVVLPGGGSWIAESGPGINEEGKEHGQCGSGGQWQNPAGQWAQTIPHAHCIREGGAGVTVTWNFSAPATFVDNGNNINLNFQDLVDHHVHYKGQQDRTAGEGLFSENLSGGTWTLDLDQFDGDGNAFASCSPGPCLNASATFSYNGTDYVTAGMLSW